MRTSDIPATKCSNCGEIMDAATSLRHNEAPEPGAITICLFCAALYQFNPAMGLVRLKQLPADADDTTRRMVDRARSLILRLSGKRS